MFMVVNKYREYIVLNYGHIHDVTLSRSTSLGEESCGMVVGSGASASINREFTSPRLSLKCKQASI